MFADLSLENTLMKLANNMFFGGNEIFLDIVLCLIKYMLLWFFLNLTFYEQNHHEFIWFYPYPSGLLPWLWGNNIIYPVHGANLTLIQPKWSAYPYAPTSLYGIHMPLLPYMVIQPIVLRMVLLWAAMDSSLSQGPLLWRHNDMTVIVSRNTRGPERDTQQRLDNANARRLQTVNRQILCWIQCDLLRISEK